MLDIKVTLRLTDRGREATNLGWEKIEVIDFGYDQRGVLSDVVCIAESSNQEATPGSFDIFTIGGYLDIFEDLFHNYEVER